MLIYKITKTILYAKKTFVYKYLARRRLKCLGFIPNIEARYLSGTLRII